MAKKKPAKKKAVKKRYRYKGKFISEEFREIIEPIAKDSGQDVQNILNDKSLYPVIDDLIASFSITWFRSPKYIATTATAYKKDHVYFYESGLLLKVPLTEAMLALSRLEGELYEKKDLIWIKYKTINRLDGKMIIAAPYLKRKRGKKTKKQKEEEEEYISQLLDEYMESDDVMYMEYTGEDDDQGRKGTKIYNPYE